MKFKEKREILISYLRMKILEADWHAVADAAMDLRELEAKGLGLALGGTTTRSASEPNTTRGPSSFIYESEK